jgi:hypothetical protein
MKNQPFSTSKQRGNQEPSTGLTTIRQADGTVLTAAAEVKAEVESYFTALF